jgi:hypothetical protein
VSDIALRFGPIRFQLKSDLGHGVPFKACSQVGDFPVPS